MNKVMMIGHLACDPELQYVGAAQKATCAFRLAVRRRYSSAQGGEADFFWIVGWGKTAENAARYLRKGSLAAVSGRLQTHSWDGKDGAKHYTTQIVADEIEFLSMAADKDQTGFTQAEDDELPF